MEANEAFSRNGESSDFFLGLDGALLAGSSINDVGGNSNGESLSLDNYSVDLFDRLDFHSSLNSFIHLVCQEDGRIVKFPLPLVPLAWPDLGNIVAQTFCCEDTEISISVPGCSSAVEHVKEILLLGRTYTWDCHSVTRVTKFLKDVGLNLNVRNEKIVDIFDELVPVLSDDEESDREDQNEEQDVRVFWGNSSVEVRNIKSCHCIPLCKFRCGKISSEWCQEDIVYMKTIFKSERILNTKNKLIAHLTAQNNIGAHTDTYVIKGQKFCLRNLSFLTDISEYVLRKVLVDYWMGIRQYEHGNKGIFKQPSVATIRFIGWFKQFLSLYGQSAPDEDLIILPYWLKGKVLYKMYCDEISKPRIALPTFYQYLKTCFGPQRIDKDYPCVRISKYSSHSVCDICVSLNFNKKLSKTEAELNMVKGLVNQHKLDFGMARKTIESIKQSAINFPSDNLFIQGLNGMAFLLMYVNFYISLVDGMDNAKSYCPRYLENSKQLVGTERLPTKIYGGLVWSGIYEEKRSITFFLNHDHYGNLW